MSKNNPKTERFSGRCTALDTETIENSNYTYGDAISYFAMALRNPKKRLEMEIKITQGEISHLEFELNKIQKGLEHKKQYLEDLKNQWDVQHGHVDHDFLVQDCNLIEESVSAIRGIMGRFDCGVDEISKYTKTDVIGLHARKCGLSRSELISLLPEEE